MCAQVKYLCLQSLGSVLEIAAGIKSVAHYLMLDVSTKLTPHACKNACKKASKAMKVKPQQAVN